MARIVFDLDGTLIDSAPDICGVANSLMRDEGLSEITLAQAHEFIGMGAAVFVARLRAEKGIPDSAQERLLTTFKDRYMEAVALTVPYPGVIKALETLRAAGHHLGICTNKPERPAHAVLTHLKMDGFFDVVIGGDSLPTHKPNPASLKTTFAALPSGPEIYVGDSEVDAETAQSAETPFLLFTEGYRKTPVPEMPHRASFSRYQDFPALVDEVLGSEGRP